MSEPASSTLYGLDDARNSHGNSAPIWSAASNSAPIWSAAGGSKSRYQQAKTVHASQIMVKSLYSKIKQESNKMSVKQNSFIPRLFVSLLYARSVVVHKGDGDLGVVLCGESPVTIQSVIPRSAAEKAGVLKGDCVISVNERSVRYVVQSLIPDVSFN